MAEDLKHIPVMLNEVLEYMDLKPGLKVIDATFGLGGHGFEIAKRIHPGILIGLEKDPYTYSLVFPKIPALSNIKLFNIGYEEIDMVMLKLGITYVDRILFDLGISSVSLECGRGFSFQKDEVLDLRFDPKKGKPAYEVLKELNEKDIERILRMYGEEKKSRIIARRIVSLRKNTEKFTTKTLANIVDSLYPVKLRNRAKARVWQALRIYINDELGNLKRGLALALKYLKVGGILAVITFHSLEDRAVKSLKNYPFVEPITKKPITPSEEELKENPRSRSAKLRIYRKIGEINYHKLLSDRRFAYPFRIEKKRKFRR